MAPSGESLYFPPLDRCLSREHILISWKTAYTGLTQPEIAAESVNLHRFLSDPHTVRLLQHPFDPFEKPTSQTQSSFETKTAAINVTPSVHGEYDINEIKGDALWLSKETGIDELGALRIVVQQWQTRPIARLLLGFSEEEAVGLQDVARANGFGRSFLGLHSLFVPTATGERDDFTLASNQRRRLIELYLSERRYILKVCEWLVHACFQARRLATTSKAKGSGSSNEKERSSWVIEVGGSILNADHGAGGALPTNNDFILECIGALRARIDDLRRGSGLFETEGGREDVEEVWFNNYVLESIHIMELLFLFIDSSAEITVSSVTLAWFRFASQNGFFEQFDAGYSSTTELVLPFQSMTALVSLALLKLPLALNNLFESQDMPALLGEQSGKSPYIVNSTTIKELNEVFLDAAGACITTASPAVFAWGIIMQSLRGVALTAKESRELRQSQRAADEFARYGSSGSDAGVSPTIEDVSRPPSRRRTSTSSEASLPTVLAEEILDNIMDCSLDEDPIVYLAKSAVNGSHVFDVIISLATDFCPVFCGHRGGVKGIRMRVALLDLIRASLVWVDYLPEVVLAVLAVLSGADGSQQLEQKPATSNVWDPASVFLRDEILMDKLFKTALSRFPYESLPFLRLCKALAASHISNEGGLPLVCQYLTNLETFTHTLPSQFNSYQLVHEDENANYVALTRELEIFSSRDSIYKRKLLALGQEQASTSGGSNSLQIPEGTNGRVLSESKPVVAIWNYHYSGFKYLGRILESFLISRDLNTQPPSEQVTRETVVESIALFSTILETLFKSADSGEHNVIDSAQTILEEASDGLDRNGDVISTIFDILEKEVQGQHSLSGLEGSLDLTVQCMHFVRSLIPIMPGRVWPLLARSGLLEMDGKGGLLAALITSNEIVNGHYSLLLAAIRTFDALVEDAVSQAIPRKVIVKTVVRFATSNRVGTGIPDSVMRKVLLALGRTIIDIFESSVNWRFVKIEEKLEVHTRIANLIDRVLLYCYGVGDSLDPSKNPSGVLAPLADYLLDVLLSTSSNELAIQPLLRILADGIVTPESTVAIKVTELWTLQVGASLKLCVSLIQLGLLLQRKCSNLEQQLFKTVPVLVRLYVVHETYRIPVISLFGSLVRSAARHDAEPPSLLGHLGARAARSFLDALADLDKPLDSEALSISIWNLLSAVISNRQPWFATYLLTGTTPRDSLKTFEKSAGFRSTRGKPLLAVALDTLSKVQEVKPRKALALLEFVASAEDYWPWVMSDTHSHLEFLSGISNFLGGLESRFLARGQERSVSDSQYLRMASYIAEILAMYLHHHSKDAGDNSVAKDLVSNVSHVIYQAVQVPSYNASLHGNLRQNFEKKFPGCSPSHFKRTLLTRRELGEDYFYDIKVAEKMLEFDPAWSGARGQGFAHELARANINLSVVESQVNLLHSCKFIAIELVNVLPPEKNFQKSLVKVVNDCLLSNSQTNLPENIFHHLKQVRAELAFVLLQRLIETKSREPEAKALLSTAWNTIYPSGSNLDLAITTETEYYRSLLKCLFLALQFHLDTSSNPRATSRKDVAGSKSSTPSMSRTSTASTPVILEIITILILPGFRRLTTELHDDSRRSSSAAGDFVLLTAILQTALRIPEIDMFHSQIITYLAENQTARYATTLFSWSDQLTIDGDPIYGELSILFLVELSSIPNLAEYLATESILTHLSNANIMDYFRRPNGSGPFDEPPRLYAIWSRGILPLCLNLVNGVGAPIAGEISAFLNQFPGQLARAANAFDNKIPSTTPDLAPTYITLALASEVHSLALITYILDNYHAAGPSAGIVADEVAELRWDKTQVKEDLDSWLQGRAALREKIVPTDEKEVVWAREKPIHAGSGAENRLEEKVLEEMNSALVCLGANR